MSSDPTQIRFLVKQLGLEYPVLTGNDKVSDAYGSIAVVPTTVIIDKQGNINQTDRGHPEKRNLSETDRAFAVTGLRAQTRYPVRTDGH